MCWLHQCLVWVYLAYLLATFYLSPVVLKSSCHCIVQECRYLVGKLGFPTRQGEGALETPVLALDILALDILLYR